MTIQKQVIKCIAQVLSIPEDKLSPETQPSHVAEWTSLIHLNIVMQLEQTFKIQFSPQDLLDMNSIELITYMIETHKHHA